jgi:hypothetical protein
MGKLYLNFSENILKQTTFWLFAFIIFLFQRVVAYSPISVTDLPIRYGEGSFTIDPTLQCQRL